MSTRTLTPDDPHAPREPRHWFPWTFVAAAVLAVVLLTTAFAMDDSGSGDPAAALLVLGIACAAYALLGGPVYKWGPVGILFVLGLLLVLGGIAGAVGVKTAETVTVEQYRGDDDGDGAVDEDDFGDADNSANDPTQIDGPEELLDHDDDDSDGEVDEDPKPVFETHSEVRAGLSAGRDIAIGVTILGVVLLAAFFAAQNTAGRARPAGTGAASSAPSTPLAADAPTEATAVGRGSSATRTADATDRSGPWRIGGTAAGVLVGLVGVVMLFSAPFVLLDSPENGVTTFVFGTLVLGVGGLIAGGVAFGPRGLLLGLGVTLVVSGATVLAAANSARELAAQAPPGESAEIIAIAGALSTAGLVALVVGFVAAGLFIYLQSRHPAPHSLTVTGNDEG